MSGPNLGTGIKQLRQNKMKMSLTMELTLENTTKKANKLILCVRWW